MDMSQCIEVGGASVLQQPASQGFSYTLCNCHTDTDNSHLTSPDVLAWADGVGMPHTMAVWHVQQQLGQQLPQQLLNASRESWQNLRGTVQQTRAQCPPAHTGGRILSRSFLLSNSADMTCSCSLSCMPCQVNNLSICAKL